MANQIRSFFETSTRGFEPPTPRLGGECSILLSYVDMPIFWLKINIFRQSAVAAVFMISDGFRRPETPIKSEPCPGAKVLL